MSYWWMNVDPEKWNIFENLSPRETEGWGARTDGGRYKAHARTVQPGDLALCHEIGKPGALVAELEATSSLKPDEGGEEVVNFRLKRYLNRVPWAAVVSSQIVPVKHHGVIRRGTLFPLEKEAYEALLRLSEANTEQRDREEQDDEEQDDLVRIESERDLSRIRDELRNLKLSDPELISFKGESI